MESVGGKFITIYPFSIVNMVSIYYKIDLKLLPLFLLYLGKTLFLGILRMLSLVPDEKWFILFTSN